MQPTIGAGAFKARCLKLLDDVAESKQALVITKHGRPVAKLVPLPDGGADLFGALKGSVLYEDDIVSPTHAVWEACE